MGCQDLLESVPGRVTSFLAPHVTLSEAKSLKVRGRSANGKTTKADELSCKSTLQLTLFWFIFTSCGPNVCVNVLTLKSTFI